MKLFVSGCTGGIGSAVCKHLASEGHNLVLTSRDASRLDVLRQTLSDRYSVEVATYAGDFSSAESIRLLTGVISQEEQNLDGYVLIYPRIDKPADFFPDEKVWQENFLRCFVRPLSLLGGLVHMLSPGSKIVVVSGIASTQVFPGLNLTNALRSAWLAQTKTLSFSLGRQGININSVSLGGILTERIREKIERASCPTSLLDSLSQEHELNALGRWGDPEEAAHVIVQMLSSFANHLTGTNIVCDGGYSRHYC